MTLEEACALWVDRDFSAIPTTLMQKAYRDDPENLEQVAGEAPTLDYPCGWVCVFQPVHSSDETWFKDNLDVVAECGFLAYEADESGFFLALDAAGYDFLSEHWIPLYKKRGLTWHENE